MEQPSIRAAEVLQLAQNFRMRAAETGDTVYHRMMLRTAAELEELAQSLCANRNSELVLVDDEDDSST